MISSINKELKSPFGKPLVVEDMTGPTGLISGFKQFRGTCVTFSNFFLYYRSQLPLSEFTGFMKEFLSKYPDPKDLEVAVHQALQNALIEKQSGMQISDWLKNQDSQILDKVFSSLQKATSNDDVIAAVGEKIAISIKSSLDEEQNFWKSDNSFWDYRSSKNYNNALNFTFEFSQNLTKFRSGASLRLENKPNGFDSFDQVVQFLAIGGVPSPTLVSKIVPFFAKQNALNIDSSILTQDLPDWAQLPNMSIVEKKIIYEIAFISNEREQKEVLTLFQAMQNTLPEFFQDFGSALNTFISKYNALPGAFSEEVKTKISYLDLFPTNPTDRFFKSQSNEELIDTFNDGTYERKLAMLSKYYPKEYSTLKDGLEQHFGNITKEDLTKTYHIPSLETELKIVKKPKGLSVLSAFKNLMARVLPAKPIETINPIHSEIIKLTDDQSNINQSQCVAEALLSLDQQINRLVNDSLEFSYYQGVVQKRLSQ